ncbi:unnamed protein product [Hermetia illucens]|uniref:Uncharacterized protein n=1 Tax=Hermetia illucens TaxID=343691 RepID=A0A7R8USA3_HERIL|nr:unnamed protein product [Hermetia illucens]
MVTADVTVCAKFLKNDEQARALIGLFVQKNSQVVHIRNDATANAAWNSLRNYRKRNTLGNKVSIMFRICGLKLTEGGDMEKHIVDFTDFFQKLVDLGDNVLSGK